MVSPNSAIGCGIISIGMKTRQKNRLSTTPKSPLKSPINSPLKTSLKTPLKSNSSPKKIKSKIKSKVKSINNTKSISKENNKTISDSNTGNLLYGYESELKYLTKIVNNTITTGESNSVLICGDPGSGKTKLVETYLQSIKFNDISIIRLNGFINSNDLSTIRLIGRHFGINANTISDIMSSLKEICKENPLFRAFIILDRFDIFCRRNQTLLYNLFDLLQNSQSICVIGMTTRLDSIDLLEKRVKSRLNQRIIHLVTPFVNFDDYMKYALKELKGQEMNNSLRESLKIQYSLNYSIRELKRVIFEGLVTHKIGVETSDRDAKLFILSQMSIYEVSVLLIANKYTKNQNTTQFHCSAIMDALRHLPQIKINKNLLFKIFHKLEESDLITRHSTIKSSDLLLSEWTKFSLNIDDSHLNQILKSNVFPQYMRKI
ncbi:origin recognition complex subunit 4-like [Oppia nitens]|uniref:origin recognition complex subunit 4-like n=1 Tax=Oppia nitens TaxID=1686743 RepID=UPI0023DAF891|nr:origin recognition complex subunit 4-like [Oppia nitens]